MTYTPEYIKHQIETARLENRAVVFKNLAPEVPSWERIIKYVDKEIHTGPGAVPMEPLNERVINGVILHHLFYMMVRHPYLSDFPELAQVQDSVEAAIGVRPLVVNSIVNYISGEEPIPVHSDDRETFYWQCQGEAVWQIYDDWRDREPSQIHALEPGDVIYLPRKVNHSVQMPTPRMAVVFSIGQDNSVYEEKQKEQNLSG
jgi:mannose-6-phosphate isomerase-like protein (cupin superfamily)